MINANELRIGNIVNDEDLHPMYIAGLWPVNDGKQYNFKDSAGNSGNVSLLSGVPLTEEWLLKFGFTHDIGQNKSYYSKGKLTINMPDDYHKSGRTYFNSWAIIEYSPKTVHHLMNIYHALTQEELCLKP